jgi:hypothetical protein
MNLNVPMRSMIGKFGHFLGEGVRILLIVGIFVFWGYLFYKFFGWLLFGNGESVLILACFIFAIYLVFGFLPDWLSRRWECTKREAARRVNLFLLFLGGICLGSYWIPANMNLSPAWYWRIVLGLAVGWLALITRRYR